MDWHSGRAKNINLHIVNMPSQHFEEVKRKFIQELNETQNHSQMSWCHTMLRAAERCQSDDDQKDFFRFMELVLDKTCSARSPARTESSKADLLNDVSCELSWNQLPIHSDYRRSDDRVTLDSDLVTLDGRCRSKTQFLVTKSDPDFGDGRSVARTVGTHTHRFLEGL